MSLYEHTTGQSISSTITALKGTTLSITPTLSPYLPAGKTPVYKSGTTVSLPWNIPITGTAGTTLTKSLSAYVDNIEIASRTIQIKIVECTSTNLQACASTPICQTPVCNNGMCGISITNNGASCGTNGEICSSGVCTGCTSTCDPITETRELITTNGCTVTTSVVEYTTARTCQSATCVSGTVTNRTISTTTTNVQNGESCNNNQVCWNGACVNSVCAQHDPSVAINWTGNFSICNGAVAFCGETYVRNDFLGTSCNDGKGLCTAEDTCTTKCPETGICSTVKLDHTIPNNLACSGGATCYLCDTASGYIYEDGRCVPDKREYRFSLSTSAPVAQTPVTITPLLTHHGKAVTNSDHQYSFLLTTPMGTSSPSFETITVTFPDPGDYPLTLTARDVTETPIMSTSTVLSVSCPANNPCCPHNSNAYLPEGSACNNNGQPGTCQNNVCINSCTPTGAEVCNNKVDDDCNGLIDCQDNTCSESCNGLACNPGKIACNNACTDTSNNPLHCGACNNRCGNNEQCISGECTEVLGCDVICNTDQECGRGHICINPGSCTSSYCAPSNTITTTPEGISSIMSQYAKTYRIEKALQGAQLHLQVINLAPVPLHNYTLIINIPKELASSASELGASKPFTVIQEDPVISIHFNQIGASDEVTIDLPTSPAPALLSRIQVSATHQPLNQTPQVLSEELTITSNLVKDGENTKLLLGLAPHATLSGVRVPVQIPKCIAASASELKLQGDYEIIQDDPLVVWTFDTLTSKETIEIGITGEVTTECKNQLTAFAVADTIDKPLSPWIPLLLIPIIGMIIATFSRYHPGSAERRLSREEFTSIAREQGRTEEEVREEWEEYERRF